ncbi:MAG: hypothetical protein IT464_07835 [Planctomycetes bacterium]|nr:hypothetical protein [Planctomycetota bacterium]
MGTDQDSGEAQLDPWTRASRWLWAGYMYEPPLVGYTGASGVERKAPGPDNDPATPDANLKGQYYCWNRTYDIGTGRWTTPDPAMQYANLHSYVGERPTGKADSSGLKVTSLGTHFTTNDTCQLEDHLAYALDKLRTALKRAETDLQKRLDDGFSRSWYVTATFFVGGRDGITPQQLKRVLNVVRSVLSPMELKDELKFICHCDCTLNGDPIAFVYPDVEVVWEKVENNIPFWNPFGDIYIPTLRKVWSKVVHLCPKFWDLEFTEMAADIFHELTHGYAQTEDYGYYAGKFTSSSPEARTGHWKYDTGGDHPEDLSAEQRLNNADTYASWLFHVYLN